jgi:hypothetical protein
MPQEYNGAGELDHGEEIFRMIFPTHDDAAKIVKPGEQAFDFPAATIAAQRTAVLRDRFAAVPAVRRDQLHAQTVAQSLVQWIAVIGFVTDQSRGSFGEKSLPEAGFDEDRFIWSSAGHVHGDRKTMAVCNCHDFAAFPAFCRADTRAPFFAELKLASMNASLRSSLPRSRKSSASFCSKRVSSPERCHC